MARDTKLRISFDGINFADFGYATEFKIEKPKNLPERYIINKNATILFWNDDEKTVVKKTKDDKYDKRLGFLIAYFQYNSGLSKSQANKYLDNLVEENEKS